jgi:hypothetical protein
MIQRKLKRNRESRKKMKTGSESSFKEELTTIELDLTEEAELVANMFINEGRRREREEIVELLMAKYDELCCCDSASFGSHYLADCQPDNLIKLISNRPVGQPPTKKRVWDGSGWNYRA